MKVKLTVCANADVTSGVIHAGSFPPLFRHRIETSHRIEMLIAVKPADHVNEIVQNAKTVIGPRRYIRVH